MKLDATSGVVFFLFLFLGVRRCEGQCRLHHRREFDCYGFLRWARDESTVAMDTRVCMVDSVEHFLSWPRCAGVRRFGETWRSTDQYDYELCYGAGGHALRGNERCVSAVFFCVDVATQQKLERYHGRDRAQAVLIEAVGTSRCGHDMSSVCVGRRVAAEREREGEGSCPSKS